MNKVSLVFVRLSDGNLLVFAENVITAMTGNANFATPSPTLLAVTALKDAFSVAIANAYDGGRTLTAIKNAAKKELVDALRLLASYVEDHSANDYAVMLSSGFEVTTFASLPRPVPAAPENVRLSDGDTSGMIKVRVNVVPEAVVYEVRFTTDEFGPESRWENLPASTSTTMQIAGIAPAGRFGCRCALSTVKGQGVGATRRLLLSASNH